MKVNITDHEIICFTPQNQKQDSIAARHAKKPDPTIHSTTVFQINKTKTLDEVYDHYQDSRKWFQKSDDAAQFIKQGGIKNVIYGLSIYIHQQQSLGGKAQMFKIMKGTETVIALSQLPNNRVHIVCGASQTIVKAHFSCADWNQTYLCFSKDTFKMLVNQKLIWESKVQWDSNSCWQFLFDSRFEFGGGFQGKFSCFYLFLNWAENKLEDTNPDSLPKKEINCLYDRDDQFAFVTNLYELGRWQPRNNKFLQSRVSYREKQEPRMSKVALCHDIPAGVCEEKWSQGHYAEGQMADGYRFVQWDSIDIFIYFGHYTVTIPPPAWIDIGHKHGVKMLGTLIFEQWGDRVNIGKEAKVMLDGKIVASLDLLDQSKTCSNELYAEKLVEICKHHGFEGYLMNFEVKIEKTEVLLTWLKYLRRRLHEEIIGAELMWYDSIIHNGDLQWQSALNDKNWQFLQVCDSFFTDYHWQPQNLEVTLNTFVDKFPDRNTFDVYIGSDCYGRGTYGGGKFDVYKALQEIQNFPFSVAIFGQAFTYEMGESFTSQEKFQENEDLFWHGIERKQTNLLTYNTPEEYMKVWQIQKQGEYGQWALSKEPTGFEIVASHANNVKTAIFPYKYEANHAEITFTCKVQGTGPNFADKFNATLILLDQNHQQLSFDTTGPSLCSASGAVRYLTLKVSPLQNAFYLKVEVSGQDVEHWGGNFGSRFSGERLSICNKVVKFEDRRINKSDNKVSPVNFSCDFNFGVGNNYFIDGQKVLDHKWSNYSEFDFSLCSNRKTESNHWPTFTESHWNGGSSLQLGQEGAGLYYTLQYFETQAKDLTCDFKIVYQGNLVKFCGILAKSLDNGTWETFSGTILYPKDLQLICSGKVRIGHISFTEPAPKEINLAWDNRSDLNDNCHKVVNCLSQTFTGKSHCNYYIAWKVGDGSSVKNFRVFRNDNFIGVVNTFMYVDKHVELTKQLTYKVQAVSFSGIVLAEIRHNLE